MMRPLLVFGFFATSVAALFVSGCSDDGDQTASAEDDVRTRRAAQEGELCANGVFGTPNIQCAAGLECKYPNNSTAPTGPSGSSSASTGTCAKL